MAVWWNQYRSQGMDEYFHPHKMICVITYACPYLIQTGNACKNPDSKVHGTNMGPIWGRRDPGGPDVGPMDIAIWV